MELENGETAAFNAVHNEELKARLKEAMKGHFDLRNLTFRSIQEYMGGYDVVLQTGQGFTYFEGVVTFREVQGWFGRSKFDVTY